MSKPHEDAARSLAAKEQSVTHVIEHDFANILYYSKLDIFVRPLSTFPILFFLLLAFLRNRSAVASSPRIILIPVFIANLTTRFASPTGIDVSIG